MERTTKRRGFGRRVKGFLGIMMVLAVILGFALQSREFTEFKSNVYSDMEKRYLEADMPEESAKANSSEIVETAKVTKEKNYVLTMQTDLRNPSNLTAEELDIMLEGTALHGLGQAFVEAEQKYNVNSLYMLGLACLESGYGTSKYATDRYNLYGFGAYDSNPDLAKRFDGWVDSTMFVASYLQRNYLTEGAIYFHGYTPEGVDVKYASDPMHGEKIISIVERLEKKLGK